MHQHGLDYAHDHDGGGVPHNHDEVIAEPEVVEPVVEVVEVVQPEPIIDASVDDFSSDDSVTVIVNVGDEPAPVVVADEATTVVVEPEAPEVVEPAADEPVVVQADPEHDGDGPIPVVIDEAPPAEEEPPAPAPAADGPKPARSRFRSHRASSRR